MNTITLEHFSNKSIGGVKSNGIWFVQNDEVVATIAIDCDDHTESHDNEDPNNFGVIELHDMSELKHAGLSFNLYPNKSAMRVPALKSVCVDLGCGRQCWVYNDEEDRRILNTRLVQLVHGGYTQYMEL